MTNLNRNSSQICFSNILLSDMQKIWHAACSTALSRHRETSSCERNCVTAGSGYYFRTSVLRVPATLTDVAHHLFLLCLEKFTLILKKNERFTFSYGEMSGLCADNQQFEKYANDTKKLPVCKGCFWNFFSFLFLNQSKKGGARN